MYNIQNKQTNMQRNTQLDMLQNIQNRICRQYAKYAQLAKKIHK